MKTFKYSPTKIKKLLAENGKEEFLVSYFVACEDNQNPAPYSPSYWAGDLIATYCGHEQGSMSWSENLGSVL